MLVGFVSLRVIFRSLYIGSYRILHVYNCQTFLPGVRPTLSTQNQIKTKTKKIKKKKTRHFNRRNVLKTRPRLEWDNNILIRVTDEIEEN